MPLYFFDIVDGGSYRDDVGTECADDDAVRDVAKEALPDIAREEIPKDGDKRAFTVVARSVDDKPIYTATITYTGMWLRDRPADD